MTTLLDSPTARPPQAPTRPVRAAWRAAGSLAAVALLVWGATELVDLLAHEERTLVRTFDARSVDAVDVEVDRGSVSVTAGDVDEVTVEAHVSDGLLRTEHEQVVDGSSLVLRGHCRALLSHFCAVDYEVRVPPDVAVLIRTDDGRIRVDGTDGPVDVASDNGTIELFDVRGDVLAESDNGSLRGEGLVAGEVRASTDNGSIVFGFAEPPTLVDADSDNGSVELRLPEVAGGYRVTMDTDVGDTDLGVATDPDSPRSITATTDNGSVRVLGSGATVG